MHISSRTVIFCIIGLTHLVNAASVARKDEAYNLSPEEWQAKWDAWPEGNATTLRRRLAASRESFHEDVTPGEVCERIVGCLGSAAATTYAYGKVATVATVSFCATQANAATNAFMANNYKLAKQVAAYVVTEIALPLIINEATFYINLKLQNDAPQSKDDQCGVAQTPAIAEQAGTAMYGFCLQIQKVTSDKAFSRVDFGTVSTDNTNDDVGLDLKSRMLISTVQDKFAPACSLLGVYLKRYLPQSQVSEIGTL